MEKYLSSFCVLLNIIIKKYLPHIVNRLYSNFKNIFLIKKKKETYTGSLFSILSCSKL